jgi:hypothetical protein
VSQLRPVPPTHDGEVTFAPALDRIVRAGIALTLAAVLLQTAIHIANALTVKLEALDADAEHTVFSWLGSAVTFSTTVACVLLVATGLGRGRVLLPLAGLVAFLSLDEAISVHERIGTRVAHLFDLSIVWSRVIWPTVYFPLLLTVFALLLAAVWGAPRATFRLVLFGLVCLGVAVATEIVSAPLSITVGAFAEALVVGFEEGFELAGWGLIATGLLSLFGSRGRAGSVQPTFVSRA